eukprot:8887023-Pyramimonas_sp.AAC.1
MLLQSLSTHPVELQRAFVLHRRAVVPGGPGAEPRAEPHDAAPALGAPMKVVVPRTPGSMHSGGTHPWDAAIDQDLEGTDAHGDARGQPTSTP